MGKEFPGHSRFGKSPKAMQFDIVTIFPEFFGSILSHGVLKRALSGGHVTVRIHDLRDFTSDRHRTVDDRPFGGGPGMVLKPGTVFLAVESIRSNGVADDTPIVLLSPQGRLLRQSIVEEFSRHPRVILICGRYEGMDERVADFLGNEESAMQDSFADEDVAGGQTGRRLLDWPHYTRPAEFRGMRVPEVLLSGDHEEIRRWRRRRALEKTLRRRPDLLASMPLNEEDRQVLEELKQASLQPALPQPH